MIIDRDETTILDHAAWGQDSHSLWRYQVEASNEEKLDWPARPFMLFPGRDRIHVTMVERDDDEAHIVTIRLIADVETVVASATHRNRAWTFDGPSEIWKLAPSYVVVERGNLLHIHPNDADLDPLVWYEQGYDLNYQGLGPAYEIPDSHLLLISIQRDSNPVIYDPLQREVRGHISLAREGREPIALLPSDGLGVVGRRLRHPSTDPRPNLGSAGCHATPARHSRHGEVHRKLLVPARRELLRGCTPLQRRRSHHRSELIRDRAHRSAPRPTARRRYRSRRGDRSRLADPSPAESAARNELGGSPSAVPHDG